MNLLLWLIFYQVTGAIVTSIIRSISFKYYLSKRGYKMGKKPFLQWVANSIIAYIKIAIPIFGILVIIAMVFAPDELIFKQAIRDGQLKRISE